MAQYLNFDWRNVVQPNELITRIDNLLSKFDSDGKMDVQLLNSTCKKLVTRDVSGLSHNMILQKVSKIVKVYEGGSGPSASATDKYIGRMLVISELVLKLVDASEQNTHRNIYYRLREGAFTEAQIDQCYKDLALTIGVHPYNLGRIPEMGKSFVRVPSGVQVGCREVANIFKLRAHAPIRETKWSGTRNIPPMVQSIRIIGSLRAVVVSEHRSIKDKFDIHADEPGFEGILLVLTGGFPDAACREFLHLLAINPALDGVPFLWISDCDSHSLQMYSTIKYGSAHQAYASSSMICPQLVFGGVTMEKFEAFHRTYPQRYVDGQASRGELSDEKRAQLLSAKALFVEERLKRNKTCSSGKPDQADRQRVAGLRKAKTLDTGEELALKQLNTLAAGGTKVSLVQLDEFGQDGVALFIAEQVAAVRGEALVRPALFGDWSQTRAVWRAASQMATPAIDMTMFAMPV